MSFLRERQEASKRKTSEISAAEGDIVLVYDDTPRSTWKMGRIQELYKGNDGHERSTRVRTQGRDITRALYKLYPFELTIIEESNPDETAEDLRENNTSVVEMSEVKNDLNLSSDCRMRHKAFTTALKCLKDTLDKRKRISVRGEYVVNSKLYSLVIMSNQKLTHCFTKAKSKTFG